MNLFYLDEDHDLNAQYHVDKHVVKMILEACEMLCQAYWVQEVIGFTPRELNKEEYAQVCKERGKWLKIDPEARPYPYLGYNSHINHPSTIWVRSSRTNFEWTYNYAYTLDKERLYRNPKGVPEHRGLVLLKKVEDIDMPDKGFTKFALAMKTMKQVRPDLYDEDRPVWSYRNFYMLDKATFANWKGREKPPWWDENLASYDQRISQK